MPESRMLNGESSRKAAAEEVERALAGLAETERQVLCLRNRSRCSFAEIARDLGCSENEARLQWFRAVLRLADNLESRQ